MADACRSACTTGPHPSYGACLRASTLHVAYCDSVNFKDATRQKKWDRELQGYRDARAEGIDPAGTSWSDINKARRISDQTGQAYVA